MSKTSTDPASYHSYGCPARRKGCPCTGDFGGKRAKRTGFHQDRGSVFCVEVSPDELPGSTVQIGHAVLAMPFGEGRVVRLRRSSARSVVDLPAALKRQRLPVDGRLAGSGALRAILMNFRHRENFPTRSAHSAVCAYRTRRQIARNHQHAKEKQNKSKIEQRTPVENRYSQ